MTRPAQTGDLAFLVVWNPENAGIIVEVGPPAHNGQSFRDVNGRPVTFESACDGPAFVVTSQGRPIVLHPRSGRGPIIRTMTFGWSRDRLIPILDEPGEDETLTWKDVPITVTKEPQHG
jgi:hypothetical protein